MFSPSVFNVIDEQIKQVKKAKKEYYAKTDWLMQRTGDLKPHMLSARLEALNDLKKALRKVGIHNRSKP